MRLTDDYYISFGRQSRRLYNNTDTNTGKQKTSESAKNESEEALPIFELAADAEKDALKRLLGADDEGRVDRSKDDKSGGGLDDPTARLTKRLVTAKVRDEVVTIMSEAYKALGEALKAAANGDEEAIEVVRRLNKLIRRISRKLNDLDKETDLRRKEKRAKKQELEQLAKQHEMELKRRMAERKKRERKYLDDPDAQDKEEKKIVKISFGAMSQAELEMMIRQMMPAVMSSISIDTSAAADIGAFSDASVSAGDEAE